MALRVLAIPGRGGVTAGQTVHLSEQEGGETEREPPARPRCRRWEIDPTRKDRYSCCPEPMPCAQQEDMVPSCSLPARS